MSFQAEKKQVTVASVSGSVKDIFDVTQSTYLKGVAILMLVFHHCFLSPKRYAGQTVHFLLPEKYVVYFANSLKICVCLFLFISAYAFTKRLMALSDDMSAAKRSTVIRQLLTSRLVKLIGGFAFAFCLVILFALFYDRGRIPEIYGWKPFSALQYLIVDMLGLAELLQTPTFLGTFWYYSLAIVMLFLTPALFFLLKKIGTVPFLCLMTVINFMFTFKNPNMYHYFLCIGVSIVCAWENVITRIVNYRVGKGGTMGSVIKFLGEGILLFVLMVLRQGVLKGELYPVWDAVIPIVVVCICCEFIFRIPVLKEVLKFLGIYSANIFILHNFIRSVWFYDFTYSFKYPLLITAVLVLISLALSIFVEFLKKLLHYNQFLNRMISVLNRESQGRDN